MDRGGGGNRGRGNRGGRGGQAGSGNQGGRGAGGGQGGAQRGSDNSGGWHTAGNQGRGGGGAQRGSDNSGGWHTAGNQGRGQSGDRGREGSYGGRSEGAGYGGQGRGQGDYRGRGGNFRGDRGRGRGGGRGSPRFTSVSTPPTFVNPNENKDPYSIQSKPVPQKELGWADFPENKSDVIIQEYKGQRAKWFEKTIAVSVNHFLVKSKKDQKTFPFPMLFHYIIDFEMVREKKDDKPKQEEKPGPSKKKRGGKKKGEPPQGPSSGALTDVQSVQIKLEGTSISDKKKTLPKHLTKMVLDYLIPKIRAGSGLCAIATDGSRNLYSTRRFHEATSTPRIEMQHVVTFAQLREAGLMEEESNGAIRVTFEPALDKATGEIKTIDPSDIARRYQENNGTLQRCAIAADKKQTLEAACNAFVKSFPDYLFYLVGRSTMVPHAPTRVEELGGGIVAWRGVSANITMGWKPYLNVDIANCTFLSNRNVLDVLREIIPRGRDDPGDHVNDVNSWSDDEYEKAKGFLKTCKITYVVDGHKLGGPIRDMGGKCVSESTFRWEEKNRDVSVLDYYKERYRNVNLRFPNGPVLIIRNSSMVPAELCTIKKGQSYNRKLDGKQTSSMLKFAKQDPYPLYTDIKKQFGNMNLEKNQVLKELGIQIPNEMLSIKNARVIVPPALRYGTNNNSQVALVQPIGGEWEIWSQDYSFYNTVKVDSWSVLVLGCRNIKGDNDRSLWTFIESLIKNGKKKGVEFVQSRPRVIVDSQCREFNSPQKNLQTLKKHFEAIKTEAKNVSGSKFVIVVLPQKASPLYSHVKHAAEVDVGILTQCVAEPNIADWKGTVCKDATIQNILLKINGKLGGINYVTVPPLDIAKASQFCKLITECPIMVLGADVTHAPPGSIKYVNNKEFKMPSYAAVTGSLDKTCMPFMTEVRAQRKENREAAEVILDLDKIVKNMLNAFQERTKVLPWKIIYYRDGVGEGQFPEVLHTEMTAMRRACQSISEKYQPKITFITVQKRHKTRIFHHPDPKKDWAENAPAGTVIDTEIVHPTETDFYLLSHKGMMGTSRPSRYHVLWDDSNFSHDELQSLTYTLCYMFIRCTKSVKIPAPTYYAHLAAERAKKLCDGFESKLGDPSDENLNRMLQRQTQFIRDYPMHFV